MARPSCHWRSRRWWWRPAGTSRTPRGAPTVRVPIRCWTAQAMTVVAASCWAWRMRRRRPSTSRARRRVFRQRREPCCPGCRGAGCGGPAARLGVGQMHAVFGPQGPPGHQQGLPVGAGHRVRVDDPEVDAGHPGRVRRLPGRVAGYRKFGGDLQPQPAAVGEQGDRPDCVGRVGHLAVQAQPQRRLAGRDRQPQPPPGQRERAVIPADRLQPVAPAREPCGRVAGPAAFGRREPGIGEPAQHRPGSDRVQLTEGARPGRRQLPAQRLVAGQRRRVAAAPPPVGLQHTGPHVAGRAQQPEAAPPLRPGQPQPDPGGAIHHPTRIRIPPPRHDPHPTTRVRRNR